MPFKMFLGSGIKGPRVEQIRVAERQVAVEYARNFRAKRYILRFRDTSSVRVSVPRGGNFQEAREFLQRHIPWLERQLQRMAHRHSPKDWEIGTSILLRGDMVPITLDDSVAPGVLRLGAERLLPDGGTGNLRAVVERHLWRLALRELPGRVAELAALHGLAFSRVSVRNQRTRWGSFSMRKTISLNWRLVQAPLYVRDYIILHELCHGEHMNHSHRFWRRVEEVCPDYLVAEEWLKTHGRRVR